MPIHPVMGWLRIKLSKLIGHFSAGTANFHKQKSVNNIILILKHRDHGMSRI